MSQITKYIGILAILPLVMVAMSPDYQAQEIDKILKICPGCKDWIKKYVELLKSHGYNPKK